MFGCHSLFFFFSSLRSSTLPLPHSLRPTPTSHSSISTYSIFFFRPQSSFFQCGEHFWPIPGFKCAGGRNSSSYYGSLALLFAYRRSERLLKVRLLKVSKTSCKLSLPHCPVKLLFFIAIPCVGFLFFVENNCFLNCSLRVVEFSREKFFLGMFDGLRDWGICAGSCYAELDSYL